MNFGTIITNDCIDVVPPPDARCQDPAFALSNPGICPVVPTLILKPGVALACALGSIQFKAFVSTNGVEQDVTADCVFTSGDITVALIGASTGNATGLRAGETVISAVYGDLTATARLTVLGGDCCTSRTVAIMVMVDKSYSMTQNCGGAYPRRLDLAKAAAARFISEINQEKDLVGLMEFDSKGGTVLSDPVSDKDAVETMVAGIGSQQQLTAFYAPLSTAVASLNAVTADQRVILLISDGESTADSTTPGVNSPFQVTTDFKNAGGIVLTLGCRASGVGYAWLAAMSTGGFFINAYPPDNLDPALDFVSGLKGYICAGNCTPEGDAVVNSGDLDYTNLMYWNTFADLGPGAADGYVDLLGNGFFDLIPGNGLYLSLDSSSAQPGKSYNNASLSLKTPIAVESGKLYSLTLRLAGNNVVSREDTVIVSVVDSVGGSPLLVQSVLLSDYSAGFKDFTFSFTAGFSCDAIIKIYTKPPTTSSHGPLLKRVLLQDTTDLVNLFDDNFDGENPVYVPPRCGQGTTWTWISTIGQYGYAYGYSCYGEGCLSTPPPAQLPDPNPLPNVEAGYVPPRLYTSTQTRTAFCNPGMKDPDRASATATATAESFVSQDEADRLAREAAYNAAAAQLSCVSYWTATITYTARCTGGCYGVPITKTAFADSYVSQQDATDKATQAAIEAAEAELNCNQSNNNQTISLPYGGLGTGTYLPATPMPSTKYVSTSGTITKVTVTLGNWGPHSMEGASGTNVVGALILMGPDGTAVLLACSREQFPVWGAPIQLTFDDAGAAFPTSGGIASGTYKPSCTLQPNLTVPAPAPQGPYSFALSAFIGKDTLGCWSLWKVQQNGWNGLTPVTIAGWELNITT